MDTSVGNIFIGDFNAHNVAWNCEETDTNGERLLDETEDSNLFVINSDTKSRIGEVGQRDPNIDLILGNAKAMNFVTYDQGEDA